MKKRFLFLQPFILLPILNAETAILLDTSVQTSDLVKEGPNGWMVPPESGWMDITSQDYELNTVRVLRVCKRPNLDGNFVISPFVDLKDANMVEVEVKYHIRECSTLSKYNNKQCSQRIELYVQHADAFTQRADSTSPLWNQIETITAEDAQNNNHAGPKKLLTIDSSKKGMFLAFKDYGSCSEISSVRIYFQYCSELLLHLAKYASSPESGHTYEGSCVANSIQLSYFSAPQMKCTASGWEKINATGCVCKAGYQPDAELKKCLACQTGTYKHSNGLDNCLTCPLNSYAAERGQTSCKCKPAFYRNHPGIIDHECIETPSMPIDLQYTAGVTSATLRWRKPYDYVRSDIYYRIECSQCESEDLHDECIPCDDVIIFTRGPHVIADNSSGNSISVENLEPDSCYQFKIFSMNDVTSYAEMENNLAKYGIISIRTNIEVTVKEPEIVGSVKVDLLNGRAIATWGAVDTDTYEMRISGPNYDSRPIDIVTENNEYVLDNLQTEATYRIQVRAILNGQAGTWSIAEIFRTGGATNPTVEAVESTGEHTNWIAIVAFAVVLIIALFSVLIYLFVRNINRNWSKASQSTYGKASDGTMDAHFDLIPQIVRKSPMQIDSISICSDGTLPNHSDMSRGYYHERPVLMQFGYLSDEQYTIVSALNHKNVLKIIGFSPSRQQLVFEYADNTLPGVISFKRLDVVTVGRLLRDIAAGMRFLHSHAIIHRNLACSNIFIGGDYTPKIAKYLCNDVRPDYRRSAPEVWEQKPYTTATDVWSFGIVMWETYAEFSRMDTEPYRGFSETDILDQVRSGRLLPRPAECPEQAYKLMEACWTLRPGQRPSFIQIHVELESMLNQMDPNGSVAV